MTPDSQDSCLGVANYKVEAKPPTKKRTFPWPFSYQGSAVKYTRPENSIPSNSTMYRLLSGASVHYATLTGKPLDNDMVKEESTSNSSARPKPSGLSRQPSLERFGFGTAKPIDM
ncbi:hypothetical protein D915_005900 [Fasciola hepatica]|uniref:Uncharacterized protein n=1 Tax=Fasciola hepatica TaxID=6192 RepID=A0A4E0RSH5_FASHE|nr:hypothetical protein D915_005900 [Fasciola hepatica]